MGQSVSCMEIKETRDTKGYEKDIEWDTPMEEIFTEYTKEKKFQQELENNTNQELETKKKELEAELNMLWGQIINLNEKLHTSNTPEEILQSKKDLKQMKQQWKQTNEKSSAIQTEILERPQKEQSEKELIDARKIVLANLDRFPELAKKINLNQLGETLLAEFNKFASNKEALLRCCLCPNAPPASRILLILQQLNSIVQKHDPNKLFVHAELGEEGFLQLYLLAYGLLSIGYKNIRLIPVNRDHGDPEVKKQYLTKAAYTEKQLSETFKPATIAVSTEFFGKTSDINLQTLSSLIKGKNPQFYKAHSFGIVDMYADAGYLVQPGTVQIQDIGMHWKDANSFILYDKGAQKDKKNFRAKIFLHKSPEVIKHRGPIEVIIGSKCSEKLKQTVASIFKSYKRNLLQHRDVSLARIIWNAIEGKNIILDLRENTFATEDFIEFITLSRADQNPIIYRLNRDRKIEDYMQGKRLELKKGKLVPVDKSKVKDIKDEKQQNKEDRKDEKK